MYLKNAVCVLSTVASLLCNTTLQTVIQDFIAKRKPGYSHHSPVSSSSQGHDSGKKGYSPANYEDRTHKGRQEEDIRFQRQTMNNSDQGQHYAEEYQSLAIRSEALKNEKETIVENLEGFASKIERQKKQLGNIEREEEKLQEQITELQERLETLRMHKKDYKEKFSELEDTHQQETQRLSMVKDTLRTIYNSMEKVKMLARNFNVFIGED
ncbi:golgin subfamily A member 6-like protein 7 [Ptychodera flava]|uniref:golgin subfamily A member 6-like protein 7 n=1 Tax=Ptychodera flava TaxID=63121 RepID=UPI003969EB47